jgi:flavodoxin
MRTLIVYESYHHMNTERIARAMAEALGATLAKPPGVGPGSLAGYDLVGFGSGIYFGRHHKELLALVKRLPQQQGRAAFIFSTSGAARDQHGRLKKAMAKKGFDIKGEFACRGFDTFGLLWLVGGIQKGKPDEGDVERARAFAGDMKKRASKEGDRYYQQL